MKDFPKLQTSALVPYLSSKPVPLIVGHKHYEGNEIYNIEFEDTYCWMLYEKTSHNWRFLYRFTEDANDANIIPKLSPQTNKIAMMRTPRGRITMLNNEFRIYDDHTFTTYITHSEKE